MTHKRPTNSDSRRRQVRLAQVLFAGVATVATLALCNAARPGGPESVVASAPGAVSSGGFAADNGDENFVNDNGQTSGDIFTQNAQDQSTA
jgi:hypothetical protein